MWSAPSAPLGILITGEVPLSWPRSRLSAQGTGPRVSPGGDGSRESVLEQRLRWTPLLPTHTQGQWAGGPPLTQPLPPGVYRVPSLSPKPGLLMLPGDNMTLWCCSEAGLGRFALTKDEGLSPPLHLEGQKSLTSPWAM